MDNSRDFKGVWIPKEIWLNTELTLLEKAIYVEMDSLDNENNCTAGNEYFAEFCGCSESKVSKAIKKLQDLNMIEILSFDGRIRKIRVIKNDRQSSKKYEAESQKMLPNNIYNNKNNKTISKDIVENPKLLPKPNLYSKCVALIHDYTVNDELSKALIEYLKVRLEIKDKPLYVNSWKGLLNKLDREFDEHERLLVVYQSIERGYASFFPVNKSKSYNTARDIEHLPENHSRGNKEKLKEDIANGNVTRF